MLRGVDLVVPLAGRLALVGPSGAGKTTLLRVVAGLGVLDEGRIELGGRSLVDMAPHRRPIAMVFQEPRLLPHLDVIGNVALPLRATGVRRADRRRRATALLDEVGLGGYGGRAPRSLSGGEQQRVALARALCAEPELLLLDEPLASVDPDRRESLRALIARVQRERAVTMLVVTHDQQEAAVLGDRVALMIEGRIIQCDTPEGMVHRPSTPVVARFFGGRNVIGGEVADGVLTTPAGPIHVDAPDGPAQITIRPERWRVGEGPLRMQVLGRESLGVDVRLRLGAGALVVEAHVDPSEAPEVGDVVAADAPRESVWCFPEWGDPTHAGDQLPR